MSKTTWLRARLYPKLGFGEIRSLFSLLPKSKTMREIRHKVLLLSWVDGTTAVGTASVAYPLIRLALP